ncbi:hypothetical protein [Noviherbaspirillum sedimenti]|uniref:hypothetical protein n=1 Tax=Noviherbaspirillum sedimenti TaxID=2320865 RepID=UPI0018F68A9F|nr:hypothetical protein [Noviherbaspirillum sedimenti]
MVESLSKACKALSLCCCILLLASGFAARAADNLPDPTRPPAAPDAGEAAPAAASGPVLQSVLIAAGRRVAVVSGQTVQVGDRLGDARVAKIAEGEVVLVRGGQSQTLKLFPGIEKQRATGGSTARDAGRRQ